MRTDSRQRILAFLQANGRTSAHLLAQHLNITPQAVFRHLKHLQQAQIIKKIGASPKTYYELDTRPSPSTETSLDPATHTLIEQEFLRITPDGLLEQGVHAFVHWCEKRHLPVEKTARDYVESMRKFARYKTPDGLIDGLPKFQKTFPHTYPNHVYYLDFYSIERFGKTKLGELLLYAKQSQNTSMMKLVVQEVRERILHLIQRFEIDAICFAPPTIKREVQFMKVLERELHLPIRVILVTKIKTPIIVPQKTLTKLEDRIENANTTMHIEATAPAKHVLVIDDAIGSGATLNSLARQLKERGIATESVTGLAITGSFNGFDVIQEV